MVESVVDYKSWEKGYMPPTEHILIDHLSYRGARVNTMSCYGDFTYWIVTEGFRPHGPKMLQIHELLCELAQEEIATKKAEAEKLKTEEAALPTLAKTLGDQDR